MCPINKKSQPYHLTWRPLRFTSLARVFISAARLSVVKRRTLDPIALRPCLSASLLLSMCMKLDDRNYIYDHEIMLILEVDLVRGRRQGSVRFPQDTHDGTMNGQRIIKRDDRNLPRTEQHRRRDG